MKNPVFYTDTSAFNFEVNNQRTMQLVQHSYDGDVAVSSFKNEDGTVDNEFIITPGDFVTLINWYHYQKRIGNKDLRF